MRFVPQPDRRLCQIVLVAENAEARCAEQQVTPGRRLEAEPAGGEHSRDMGARKDRDIALDSAYALNNPVGPCGYLTRSFASRAPVAEQKPARALGMDVGGAAALILSVIPFGEVGIGLGRTRATGQLGGAPRALRRAGQHFGEFCAAQPLAEGARLALTALGQRQIGAARVLTGEAPGGLAMPRNIDDGQRFTHVLLLRRCLCESAWGL